MTPRYALALAALLPFSLIAQTQNALDFDGVNDKVTVPNASALIANSTAISLTCWVYPTNPNPQAPADFDGFAGFRDNATADFYVSHENNGNVFARFRNSAGTTYTWTWPAILNTWQHLAMVYDGAQVIMYQNGVVMGTVPATGTITSTTGTFYMGVLPSYNGFDYWLDGRLDDVSLWNVALSAQEVDCIMQSSINVATPGLQLYYNMDQGVPGGNNIAVASLTDAMGNGNGVFSGIALNGPSSNFVNGAPAGTTITEQICPGESYTFNGQVLTQAGTYTASFSTGGACDSLATLVLNVTNVNTDVVQTGGNLISQAVGAQYQWLDCGNGFAEIPGATSPSFQPPTAGSYAVEVIQNGCTDTSACVSNVGIGDLQAFNDVVVRYDVGQEAVMMTGAGELAAGRANLLDAQGRSVRAVAIQQDRTMMATEGLPEGMYLLDVTSREGRRAFRVVVAR